MSSSVGAGLCGAPAGFSSKVVIEKDKTKPFLIAAAPHCGTRYMADVLKKMGLNVAHERLKKGDEIGTVSSVHLDKLDDFGIVGLQTRHPYGFLGSFVREGYYLDRKKMWRPQSWNIYTDIDNIPSGGVTHPLKILGIWYRYYEYVEEKGDPEFTYRIEDIYQDSLVLDAVLTSLGLKPENRNVVPWNKGKHSTAPGNLGPPNKRKPYNWDFDSIIEDIKRFYPHEKKWYNLSELIRAKAITYGYRI